MPRALTLALFATLTAVAQNPTLEAIQKRIDSFPGTVSLYAKNLQTGKTVALRETDPVRTASTIKLPIMLTVFNAISQGKAKWTDTLTVSKEEKVTGSGIIGTELSDGVQLPIRDVLNLMMVLSDNTATNMLIERFTAEAVNTYLDKLELPTTRLMRKVRGDGNNLKSPSGWSAAGKLPENQKYGLGKSTPKDMVTLLEKLDRGETVSPDASKQMLAIMRRCQDDTGVRRKLNGYTIFNKTGALDALRSDIALVTAKSGAKVAMAITVEGIPQIDYTPENQGSLLIADIATILVDALAIK
jgi:beta-lactamase class A